MGPNVTKHYFGDFNTTLRELINLQGNWRSNKLEHTINQRGTASTPVEFFAYINGSPANDENVNLSALADRCGYLYLTYNILWDRDYYDAFESTSWIFVLALAIDITVLLFKWSLNKGYLKKEKKSSS